MGAGLWLQADGDAWQLLASCTLDAAITWASYSPDAAAGLICTATATLW